MRVDSLDNGLECRFLAIKRLHFLLKLRKMPGLPAVGLVKAAVRDRITQG